MTTRLLRTLICLTGLFVLLLVAQVANATIVGADCYNDGDGAIEMKDWRNTLNPEPGIDASLWMSERLVWWPAHALVDFTVDTPEDPIAWITKEVENDTNLDWTGYGITVYRNQTFSILDAVAPAGWSYAITPVTLVGSQYVGVVNYTGGAMIPDGGMGTFKVKLGFLNNANFTLEQVPVTVPEPSTVVLLCVGAGLLVAGRPWRR